MPSTRLFNGAPCTINCCCLLLPLPLCCWGYQGASDVGCDPPNGGKPGDRANWGCSARSNGGQHGRRLMHGQQEREGETQAFKAQDNDSKCNCKNNRKSDLYWISAREITQHVLPPVLATGVPSDCTGYTPNTTTRVYGYGTTTQDGRSTHNWPGFTIEARVSRCDSAGHNHMQSPLFHWCQCSFSVLLSSIALSNQCQAMCSTASCHCALKQ